MKFKSQFAQPAPNKTLLLLILVLITLICSITVTPLLSVQVNSEQRIPDCLLSYQFGPQQHVVVVEKSTQNLFVYSNYKPDPVATFKITSGQKNGQKLKEGDLRTPEGIYFSRRILAGNQLPKVDDYGEKAFTLNYPNPIDHKEKRNGSGIWLHGAFDETKTDDPNNSRGCVVMKNQDLIDASKYIFLNQTPICIYDKITYDTPANLEKKRIILIESLRQWKGNWESKDIEGYIKFYDKKFSYNGMNLSRFKTYKNNLNQRYKFIRVILSDINIYAFKNYHVTTFNQLYISDINHFYSKKIQYWFDGDTGAGLSPGTGSSIVDELSFARPSPAKFEISKGNFVTVAQFRKDYLNQTKAKTFKYAPYEIHLENVSVVNNSVKLRLRRSSNARVLRVIPVLRFENPTDSGTNYRSIDGISLTNGMPDDNSKGFELKKQDTSMSLEKESGQTLKSLTLFMIDQNNQFAQIITYFINKES